MTTQHPIIAGCNIPVLSPTGGLTAYRVQILQTEGIRGFYRGCVTNLVRTTPAAAITFTSYEIISRNILQLTVSMKAQRQIELQSSDGDAPS